MKLHELIAASGPNCINRTVSLRHWVNAMAQTFEEIAVKVWQMDWPTIASLKGMDVAERDAVKPLSVRNTVRKSISTERPTTSGKRYIWPDYSDAIIRAATFTGTSLSLNSLNPTPHFTFARRSRHYRIPGVPLRAKSQIPGQVSRYNCRWRHRTCRADVGKSRQDSSCATGRWRAPTSSAKIRNATMLAKTMQGSKYSFSATAACGHSLAEV